MKQEQQCIRSTSVCLIRNIADSSSRCRNAILCNASCLKVDADCVIDALQRSNS